MHGIVQLVYRWNCVNEATLEECSEMQKRVARRLQKIRSYLQDDETNEFYSKIIDLIEQRNLIRGSKYFNITESTSAFIRCTRGASRVR